MGAQKQLTEAKLNFIKKVLREDPKAIVVFLPNSNFSMIRSTFAKVKEHFKQKLFDKSKLDLGFLESDLVPARVSREQKSRFLKHFHDHRRKLIQFRSIMDRICVVGTPDLDKLRVSGEGIPHVKHPFKFFQENFGDRANALQVKGKSAESTSFDELAPAKMDSSGSFYKSEQLVPLSFVLKLHSMDELEKKGVNMEFVYDRILRRDYEDDRKEVFNTKKFQERFEEHARSRQQNTDWDFLSNEIDFDDFNLEEKSIHKLDADQLEQNEEAKQIIKNAQISSRKLVYPLLGTWPPTNALVYKGSANLSILRNPPKKEGFPQKVD